MLIVPCIDPKRIKLCLIRRRIWLACLVCVRGRQRAPASPAACWCGTGLAGLAAQGQCGLWCSPTERVGDPGAALLRSGVDGDFGWLAACWRRERRLLQAGPSAWGVPSVVPVGVQGRGFAFFLATREEADAIVQGTVVAAAQ